MFYDYLTVEQVHTAPQGVRYGHLLLRPANRRNLRDTAPGWKHEGSYSTLIKIRVDGCKLRVEGNPSAVNRLDNLDGYRSLDDCIAVYNQILLEYGDQYGFWRLPRFTKCTEWGLRQGDDGTKSSMVGNGAYSAYRPDHESDGGEGQRDGLYPGAQHPAMATRTPISTKTG
ncbi:hypothetical protein [Pseudomonas aeruginosa]|uniref:hypothetical protein n=1 Tax=Pseudomonas aeruginosa TaxID=287 RepID=UPI0012FE1B0B|nr:hypothetical protein [Pseudomonas aeruginosa]